MTHKPPTLAQLQKQVDDFNSRIPVGTEVTCEMDSGEIRKTKTKSEAQVLMGHSAVVWMEGISGCYDIERVQKA